ncbi:cytochrome P450 [Streptomyces sp. NBC_00335]|uniref:cytochrome P450 n=1 Tax=unclassified Streptomyces TaxID=2593676 RepID=UPI002258C893|nr:MULTISPECIES: cytochrome P450 [unclassified Streptomyces]MCX5403579.1 cytochrome P450 [Streptomyces sp. NBC_00086]
MSTSRHAIPFSLIDPALHPDPDACEAWRTLRTEHPVAWCEAEGDSPGFWVITRYQDIAAVYRDTARLSSEQGNMLGTLLTGGDSAGGSMLVVTDPPRHTAVRRLLQGGFSARAMEHVVDGVRTATKGLVAAIAEKGAGDFVSDVASQIPLIAICELLDVPAADRSRMLDLTMAAMGADGSAESMEEAAEAQQDILYYYAGLLPARRTSPGADIVSLLAGEQVDGKPLSDAEVLLNCYNIIIGGDETTRLSAAGAALALIEHPEQWQRLQQDEGLLDSAVEEVLRWTTPATHIGRTATTDFTLRGSEIRQGDIVTLWNTSANRDEDVFANPYRFDISRTPNRHLTLGHGPHFCLGGPLARVELRVLLEELRSQISHMELDGTVERVTSSFLSGVCRLPVRCSAGA